jgi:hypothetical protein
MRTSIAILPTPVISDLENDKGLVQYNGNDTAVLQAEAQRGCSIHGRTAYGPLSSRCYNPQGYVCYGYEYLFACK